MSESSSGVPYTLGPEEKVFPIMLYAENALVRGEVILKQTIRLSTWFRSATASDYLRVYRAQILLLGGGTSLHSLSFNEFFIPAGNIIAAHVLPPAQETLDYDPAEPNRKMEKVMAVFGTFYIQANMRMSAVTTLGNYLSTSKEIIISLYDAEISNPVIPQMGVLRTPMVYVRPNATMFSLRT